MNYSWACSCGHIASCSKEDHKIGAVWHCSMCHTTFGQVQGKYTYPVWVTIDPKEVKFYDLLKETNDD